MSNSLTLWLIEQKNKAWRESKSYYDEGSFQNGFQKKTEAETLERVLNKVIEMEDQSKE